MLVFARTPSTIVKAEAGLLSSRYFQVHTLINSSCCASVVGQRQHQGCWTQVHWGSPYPNTSPTPASLLPTQCHLKKKDTCSAVGSEYGSDPSQVPEDHSQLVSGSHHLLWWRSHHCCHVTLARTVEKGIAFGRYTAGISFHWQLEAHYCTSLLAPWASEAAGEEMYQMPWPSHLPYTVLRGGRMCVVFLCCSGFLRNFGFCCTTLGAEMSKCLHILV